METNNYTLTEALADIDTLSDEQMQVLLQHLSRVALETDI